MSVATSATSNSRLPEECREGLADECGKDITASPSAFLTQSDVENDRVHPRMGKEDHEICGVELMGS